MPVKLKDKLITRGMWETKSLNTYHGSSLYQIRNKTNDCNYVNVHWVLFSNYWYFISITEHNSA
jgi:hypothetical protein